MPTNAVAGRCCFHRSSLGPSALAETRSSESTPTPSPTNVKPVRAQARKVRSLARWSRAVEPEFGTTDEAEAEAELEEEEEEEEEEEVEEEAEEVDGDGGDDDNEPPGGLFARERRRVLGKAARATGAAMRAGMTTSCTKSEFFFLFSHFDFAENRSEARRSMRELIMRELSDGIPDVVLAIAGLCGLGAVLFVLLQYAAPLRGHRRTRCGSCGGRDELGLARDGQSFLLNAHFLFHGNLVCSPNITENIHCFFPIPKLSSYPELSPVESHSPAAVPVPAAVGWRRLLWCRPNTRRPCPDSWRATVSSMPV